MDGGEALPTQGGWAAGPQGPSKDTNREKQQEWLTVWNQ